jgi:predicted amidohydrolase YtcJ
MIKLDSSSVRGFKEMPKRITRRDLLALTGASLLPRLLAAQQTDDRSTDAADLVVVNARVITADPRQPRAEAFAIKNGRLLGVGSRTDIAPMIRKGVATWDAGGACIVPGFIDTHNHAAGTTLLYEVLVGNPFEVQFVTIDSIIQKLRTQAAQTPPGTCVEGYFLTTPK